MLPKMLPFVASQAVAVSQAKRDASKASANGQPSATRRTSHPVANTSSAHTTPPIAMRSSGRQNMHNIVDFAIVD